MACHQSSKSCAALSCHNGCGEGFGAGAGAGVLAGLRCSRVFEVSTAWL